MYERWNWSLNQVSFTYKWRFFNDSSIENEDSSTKRWWILAQPGGGEYEWKGTVCDIKTMNFSRKLTDLYWIWLILHQNSLGRMELGPLLTRPQSLRNEWVKHWVRYRSTQWNTLPSHTCVMKLMKFLQKNLGFHTKKWWTSY